MILSPKDVALFESRVERAESGDCWPWTGRVKHVGSYGRIRLRNGKTTAAHRVAFFLATGINPANLCVCHRCDNPPCCNPEHLFLGDHSTNMRDMIAKGRGRCLRGSEVSLARLDEDQVRSIRSRFSASNKGDIGRAAAEFGVSWSTIQAILARRNWAWLEQAEMDEAFGEIR